MENIIGQTAHQLFTNILGMLINQKGPNHIEFSFTLSLCTLW
uniref:Uncharacterized protein n=1 Tax=Rhizophora mucronata TaxID=61149 RepID=A0A2P2PRK4_RHIMU